VTPEDAPALAAAMRQVLDDRPAALDRARAARRLVEEQFSHERSIGRLLTLYDELIGEGARGSSGAAAA
jgi:glycosyltransferase involved in cell wall biosynthesis